MNQPATREGLGARIMLGSLLIVALAGLLFYMTGPLAGTLVALATIGFGAWALLRRDRQGEIEVAAPPAPSREGRQVLIIVDGRAPARTLSEAIGDLRETNTHPGAPAAKVHLVVPAPASAGEQIASATDEARNEAGQRLQTLLADLRLTGVEANGEVGDPDPTTALEDGLRRFPADEVLIQAANGDDDGWRDLVERADRDAPVPVRAVPA